jgi:hypothetical protein
MNAQRNSDAPALTGWRKSSYSGGDNGSCLEVVDGLPVVPVRDSKDPAAGTLTFGPGAWSSFISFAQSQGL